MIHIVKLSGKFYGADISHLDEEEKIERIEDFANQGTPGIIVTELDDIEELGINVEEIKIVELKD